MPFMKIGVWRSHYDLEHYLWSEFTFYVISHSGHSWLSDSGWSQNLSSLLVDMDKEVDPPSWVACFQKSSEFNFLINVYSEFWILLCWMWLWISWLIENVAWIVPLLILKQFKFPPRCGDAWFGGNYIVHERSWNAANRPENWNMLKLTRANWWRQCWINPMCFASYEEMWDQVCGYSSFFWKYCDANEAINDVMKERLP